MSKQKDYPLPPSNVEKLAALNSAIVLNEAASTRRDGHLLDLHNDLEVQVDNLRSLLDDLNSQLTEHRRQPHAKLDSQKTSP